MISEGSCDTEDWRNDDENTEINLSKQKNQMEKDYFKL